MLRPLFTVLRVSMVITFGCNICYNFCPGFYKSLVPLWGRQIPYTMMKFACFERTVEALYAYVVPKPRDQCSKAEQLVVTFAAGYIAGVFCAIVSHPADTLVSYMNKVQGATLASGVKDLGFKGLWGGLGPRIIMIGTLTALQWFIYDAVKVGKKLLSLKSKLLFQAKRLGATASAATTATPDAREPEEEARPRPRIGFNSTVQSTQSSPFR